MNHPPSNQETFEEDKIPADMSSELLPTHLGIVSLNGSLQAEQEQSVQPAILLYRRRRRRRRHHFEQISRDKERSKWGAARIKTIFRRAEISRTLKQIDNVADINSKMWWLTHCSCD